MKELKNIKMANGKINVAGNNNACFKVDTELPSVENKSDKWVSEDTNSFYYDMKSED